MSAEVSLREVVDHLNMLSDESSAYLNKTTGELILPSDEELSAAEEREDVEGCLEWQRVMIEKAREVLDSDDYLKLPSKFDIHEYRVMQEFCYSVNLPQLSEQLLRNIRGSGAFGRFKQAIYSLEIEKDWYRFRDEEYQRIAVEWLEVNGIAYRKDSDAEERRT